MQKCTTLYFCTGHRLTFQVRGIAINPGKELFYMTDDGDYTTTISRLIIDNNINYPPFPDAELVTPCDSYIGKSIDVIPGTMLYYNYQYPNDGNQTKNADNPQNWFDGDARLIWMEWNGAFYNGAIRIAKNIDIMDGCCGKLVDDLVNLWERTGVTTQRLSSIYLDKNDLRIYIHDTQEQYFKIKYFDLLDNKVHDDLYTCTYPQLFTITECQTVFPICKVKTFLLKLLSLNAIMVTVIKQKRT